MLKIKSNTNEFTIIFLRRLERKRMLKRSCSASVQFSTPSSFLLLFFFFSFLVSALFCFSPLFSFQFRRSLLLQRPSFSPAIFFFSLGVLPFIYQPKILFQPKRFLAQKHFFQPKIFFSVQRHSSLLLFSALFFSGSALFFLFQCLLFFFSLTPFIQDPIFSLAASNLFYLNKSLFSSNLE